MWPAANLFACFAVTLGCGTMYAYSAYAPQLSERLGLSASVTSSIGMLGNLFMSLSGPVAGIIVDTSGFTIPTIVSVIATFTGYTILREAYIHQISNAAWLYLALCLLGIGATSAFSASVKSAAVNFPTLRGSATAITMSGYGLSAFLMSFLANVLKRDSDVSAPPPILTILWIVPTLLIAVFGPVIVLSQPRKQTKPILEDYELDQMPPERLVDRIKDRTRSERDDLYGLKLFSRPTFWLYFLMLGLLAGMGQAYIYTCGYMVKALAAVAVNSSSMSAEDSAKLQTAIPALQAHQVALLSLANCGGRLLNGTVSDTLRNKFRLSRVYSLFFSVGLCLACMLISRRLRDIKQLWLATILAGLFYGTVFGAYPGMVSDAFGVRRLSSNWGLVALAPIPFSYWLAVRIGKIYDAGSDASGICTGAVCFQGAYLLHVFLTLVVLCLLIVAIKFERPQNHL